ncbi:hypothetical protein CYMTET_47007 [Cymbomonas tetramitiformis]|uniref:Uncharacterized protein n=1 Tax=Cymbomonas tetramitiformis TaxID=36881 RepID=A0AAE0EX23_9CHLO|nr:hypothetical protein CYMTET_47007 [Cymbomonas tetramitiformis]
MKEPAQHVLFDVATARAMSDAYLGAAMRAPGAVARQVEDSKVATCGEVRPHPFAQFGMEVYGGLEPVAYEFLQKIRQRFRERWYREENVDGGEQIDADGDQDENRDEEAAHGGRGKTQSERWIMPRKMDLRAGAEHLRIAREEGITCGLSGGVRAGPNGLSQAAPSVEDILVEWEDLSSPSLEGGVWNQEQSGASPKQAMTLTEGGVTTLMECRGFSLTVSVLRVAGSMRGKSEVGGTRDADESASEMRQCSALAGQPHGGSAGPVRLGDRELGMRVSLVVEARLGQFRQNGMRMVAGHKGPGECDMGSPGALPVGPQLLEIMEDAQQEEENLWAAEGPGYIKALVSRDVRGCK